MSVPNRILCYRTADLTAHLARRAGVPPPHPLMPPPLRLAARANLFLGGAPSLLRELIADPSASPFAWARCIELAERLQRGLHYCETAPVLALRWAWAARRRGRPVVCEDQVYASPLEAVIAASQRYLDAFADCLIDYWEDDSWPAPVDWRADFSSLWLRLARFHGGIRERGEFVRTSLEFAEGRRGVKLPVPELIVEGCHEIAEAWHEAVARGVPPEASAPLLLGPAEEFLPQPSGADRYQRVIEECRPLAGQLAKLLGADPAEVAAAPPAEIVSLGGRQYCLDRGEVYPSRPVYVSDAEDDVLQAYLDQPGHWKAACVLDTSELTRRSNREWPGRILTRLTKGPLGPAIGLPGGKGGGGYVVFIRRDG